MRRISIPGLTYLLLPALLMACGGNKTEWIDFEYDKAFAYYYDNELDNCLPNYGVVIGNGRRNPSIINPRGAKLSAGQIVELSRIMGGQYTTDGEILQTDCYVPHHGIIFYKESEIVADISICFECNRVQSRPVSGSVDTEDLRMMFIYHDIPLDAGEFPERLVPPLIFDSLSNYHSED